MTYSLKKTNFKFHDTPDTIGSAWIAVGCVPQNLKDDPAFDEQIFFYCDTETEFQNLFNQNNTEDFYLLKEEN